MCCHCASPGTRRTLPPRRPARLRPASKRQQVRCLDCTHLVAAHGPGETTAVRPDLRPRLTIVHSSLKPHWSHVDEASLISCVPGDGALRDAADTGGDSDVSGEASALDRQEAEELSAQQAERKGAKGGLFLMHRMASYR